MLGDRHRLQPARTETVKVKVTGRNAKGRQGKAAKAKLAKARKKRR